MINTTDVTVYQKSLTNYKFYLWNSFIFVAVFLSTSILALNFFFSDGSPLLDQGQNVGVLWKSSFFLKNPPWFSETVSSFFIEHITLFKLFWSLIFTFLPLTPVLNFVLFHAVGVTFFIFSVQLCVQKGLKLKDKNSYFASLLALAFLFSGFIMAYNYYPHYEIYGVAFGLLFLLNLSEKKYSHAIFYFVLSLSVREDIGLHLAGILICIQALTFIKERKVSREELLFIMLGIFYSVIALACQKLFFGSFKVANIYFGSTSHLTWDVLSQRLVTIFLTKKFLWTPIFTLAIAAFILRSLKLFLGIFSLIPWFLFNILSANPLAATFQLYFSLFFVFTILWPTLMPLFFKMPEYAFSKVKYEDFLILLQSTLVLLSILFNPYSTKAFIAKFTSQTISQLETLAQTLPLILKNPTEKLVIDDSVAVLNPNQFEAKDLLSKTEDPIDSLLFFSNHGPNFIEALNAIITYKLDKIYSYGNTNVYLATNQANLNSSIPWLVKQNITFENNWKELLTSFSRRMEDSYHFSSQRAHQLFSENCQNCNYFGPNLPLPPGNYKLVISAVGLSQKEIQSNIELICVKERLPLANKILQLQPNGTFLFEFTIPDKKTIAKYSFSLKSIKGKFTIKSFNLLKQ
ncbi:MAG: hypothetical protein K2W94_07860 [Alphaproteobacteria bacterium]|nr:hypothetical protein [Alphaproteobacteria bacterium]